MKASTLIEELIKITEDNINVVEGFKQLSNEKLNRKKNHDSWSILECIEHLNRYGDFYIPEIKSKIGKSKFKQEKEFKSGFLGNYFAKNMLPKEKLNTMKTFKSMNPSNSHVTKKVLDKFIYQQKEILKLLRASQATSLTKVKTSISISKLIKLRLGDTFKVVIYHNLRHIIQAKKLTQTELHLKDTSCFLNQK